MRILFKTVLFFVFFCSCKTQNVLETKENVINKEAFGYDPNYQYRIRKDDKISISVAGEDGMSVGSQYGIYNSNEVYGKWLLVDANGNVEIPKIGTTYVVGMTLPDFKFFLRNMLKKWLIEPIVDVKILNKEITVMGEVRNPAVIQVDKDRNTLLELVTKVGGFEYYANLKAVKVLRQQDDKVLVTNIDLTKETKILEQNIQLYPGDVVIVPSKKNKEFDKRISTIIPFTTTATTIAILLTTLKIL